MKTVLIYIALVVICMMQYGDAQITAWTTPVINAADGTGTLSLAENQATGVITGTTYAATPTANGATMSYTLAAGTPFSIATGGALSLDTALDFETTSSYTLVITATENGDAAKTGVATITVTVTDVNEAPAFASAQYAATVPDASTGGAAVTTISATDVDAGDTLAYTTASTNFAIGSSTGAITVATGVTLDAGTLAGYTVTFTATDPDNVAAELIVWIAVTDCSGAGVVVASLLSLFVAFSVVLY